MKYSIRKGRVEDLDSVMSLIQELADYEKEGDQVVINSEYLKESFQKPNPAFDFLVAVANEKTVGAAIFYKKFSTWEGVCIYLEDLIVTLEYREAGVGSALLEALAKHTDDLGYRRLEWQVLDWNEPAIKFYKKHQASLDPEWINCKFDSINLKKINNEGI